MPRDTFRRERTRRDYNSDRIRKEKPLSNPFRMCPSCKQSTVQVAECESKVVVVCKHCFLRYDFTEFPAFEEIDYYNKMRDAFREDAKEGKVSPIAVASPEKVIGVCPICNLGTIGLIESPNFRSRFVKCGNPRCNARFALSYKGYFEPAGGKCQLCGWPLLYWEFRSAIGSFKLLCFNPDCTFRGKWTSERSFGMRSTQ